MGSVGESLESAKNSVAMPYESAPPFIIIVGAFCAMAGLQYVGNNIIYGKPKPMGQDEWDKKLIERDARLIEEAKQSKAKVRLYGWRGKEVDGSLLIRWYSKAAPQKNDRIYSCQFQYTHNANFCS